MQGVHGVVGPFGAGIKVGHESYPFTDLIYNQKCSVFMKKDENSGKFA